MVLSREKPDLGSIPPEVHTPAFSNPDKQWIEQGRPCRRNLLFLNDTSFNSYVPYVWGHTIYRAVFGGDSDARFEEGFRRLEAWTRWDVRMQRYDRMLQLQKWNKFPGTMPAPGERDISDEVAERMWNEVIEDYPDSDQLVTEPEGSEDFSPIGRAFIAWVDNLDVDTSGRNTRYDHCLIIDEAALQTLLRLPEQTPPVAPVDFKSPKYRELLKLRMSAWVWVLDRTTMENREDGVEEEFPPWARLRLPHLRSLWFERPQKLIIDDWQRLVAEDKDQWNTVRWWSTLAKTENEIRRADRAKQAQEYKFSRA